MRSSLILFEHLPLGGAGMQTCELSKLLCAGLWDTDKGLDTEHRFREMLFHYRTSRILQRCAVNGY